jgi:hypothetical protein
MISLIHRWVFGTRQLHHPIDLPGYGIIECTRCHAYLRAGFVISLMTHLEREHKMHEDEAIETAIHMSDLLYKMRIARRAAKETK